MGFDVFFVVDFCEESLDKYLPPVGKLAAVLPFDGAVNYRPSPLVRDIQRIFTYVGVNQPLDQTSGTFALRTSHQVNLRPSFHSRRSAKIQVECVTLL